jgi:hypothetical protein
MSANIQAMLILIALMPIFYWIALILVKRKEQKGHAPKPGRKLAALIVAFIFWMIAVIPILLLLGNIPDQSLLIEQTAEGKRVAAVYPERTNVWAWDNRVRKYEIVSYQPTWHTIKVKMQPGPSRELVYTFTFEGGGDPDSGFLYRGCCSTKSPDKWLRSHIAEFNYQYGSELAKLYNPHSDGQQSMFMNLVNDFFPEHLSTGKTGMKLVSAKFDLPD